MRKILFLGLFLVGAMVGHAQSLQGFQVTTLQNAATATGNGVVLNTTPASAVSVQVSGTFSATITFEGSINGTDWTALQATNANTDSRSTTATAPGIYSVLLNGAVSFRARVSAYTSGAVTVKARMGYGQISRSGGGGSGMYGQLTPPRLASLTWRNQTSNGVTATATETSASLVMRAAATNGGSIRILEKAVPSLPYSWTVAFTCAGEAVSYMSAGIGWLESGSGKAVTVRLVTASGITSYAVTKMDGLNGVGGGSYYNSEYKTWSIPPSIGLVWLRITEDSSNRKVYFSNDGITWIQVHTIGRTDFLTANKVFLFVDPNESGGREFVISFYHLAEN